MPHHQKGRSGGTSVSARSSQSKALIRFPISQGGQGSQVSGAPSSVTITQSQYDGGKGAHKGSSRGGYWARPSLSAAEGAGKGGGSRASSRSKISTASSAAERYQEVSQAPPRSCADSWLDWQKQFATEAPTVERDRQISSSKLARLTGGPVNDMSKIHGRHGEVISIPTLHYSRISEGILSQVEFTPVINAPSEDLEDILDRTRNKHVFVIWPNGRGGDNTILVASEDEGFGLYCSNDGDKGMPELLNVDRSDKPQIELPQNVIAAQHEWAKSVVSGAGNGAGSSVSRSRGGGSAKSQASTSKRLPTVREYKVQSLAPGSTASDTVLGRETSVSGARPPREAIQRERDLVTVIPDGEPARSYFPGGASTRDGDSRRRPTSSSYYDIPVQPKRHGGGGSTTSKRSDWVVPGDSVSGVGLKSWQRPPSSGRK